MERSDSWSAKWSCERLISHDDIIDARPVAENKILVSVKDLPRPVAVATMSSPRVDLPNVPRAFTDDDTEFLLNIVKEAFLDGDLIAEAARIPVGIGGVGDLYTAVNEKDFRSYVPKEVRFITRGLSQHTEVQSVRRLNSRTYEIVKRSGQSVSVLALNEYDLTVDALRSGMEKFGVPNFVLASNPNCRLSQEAKDAARSTGTGVLVWRQLLGALNN